MAMMHDLHVEEPDQPTLAEPRAQHVGVNTSLCAPSFDDLTSPRRPLLHLSARTVDLFDILSSRHRPQRSSATHKLSASFNLIFLRPQFLS
jgi:hypothetical protein